MLLWLLAVAGLLLLTYYPLHHAWTYVRNAPPLETGYLPFFGAVFQFARHMPVRFLEQCTRRYGRSDGAFTVHLAGRSLTFLCDPRDFGAFFTHREAVSFTQATLPFLERGFGVTPESYFHNHTPVLDAVRAHLAPKCLGESYCRALAAVLEETLDVRWRGGQEDGDQVWLQESVREVIFWSSARLLFDEEVTGCHGLDVDLETFDSHFELAAGSPLPQAFMPTFAGAKAAIHRKLDELMGRLPPVGERKRYSLAAEVLRAYEEHRGEDDQCRPAWLLSVLWAAEANSIPCSFWTIIFLLQNPELYARVVSNIREVRAKYGAQQLSYRQLRDELGLVHRCVRESIRMRSPVTIVRKTVAPLPLQNGKYVVPAGHMLMLSPAILHRDEELFPNPDVFDPDRWNDDLTLKHDIPDPARKRFAFIAFGGGPYRCPGKYFAEMEISLFLFTLLSAYDIELVEPNNPPQPRLDRLVGIQQPISDCRIRYTRAQ